MHVRLDSVLAATPAYIDPPVDHAGRDVDGDSLNLLQDLSTLHDGLFVGAAILPVADLYKVFVLVHLFTRTCS